MSNLNSRSALHPRWTVAPLRALEAFEQCIIAIFDPNSADSGNDYSPYATATGFGFGQGGFGEGAFGGGSGGGGAQTSLPIRLWQGKAQFQVYRQSLTVDDVAGSVNQIRSVRITASNDGILLPLRKGLIIRVISCPLNPTLESYEVTVTSGMSSALAWKRVIEGEVDQSVIAPPITEYTLP